MWVYLIIGAKPTLEPAIENSGGLVVKETIDPLEFRLPFAVDYFRNPKFTGRDSVFSRIDDALRTRKENQELGLVILHGAGGIGKTQIAIEYTYRRRGEFSAIFWLNARSEEKMLRSVEQVVKRILQHYEANGLHVNSPRYEQLSRAISSVGKQNHTKISVETVTTINPLTPLEAFHQWLSYDQNWRWLIVFDNLDDPESFDVRKYVPPTAWGSIIITSRRLDLAPIWDAIEVEEMDEDEALELLQKSANTRCTEHSTGISSPL